MQNIWGSTQLLYAVSGLYLLLACVACYTLVSRIIVQQRYKDSGYKLVLFYAFTLLLCGTRIFYT